MCDPDKSTRCYILHNMANQDTDTYPGPDVDEIASHTVLKIVT
jgi:hypothetical protein